MTGDFFQSQSDPIHDRMARLSHRIEELPAESRELVDEIFENFTISMEELQVAAEELQQQNQELIAARDEIEKEQRRYQDLFEFAPDGYLVTDEAGVIREVNQIAAELLAVPKFSLIGKPLVIYVTQEERQHFHRKLNQLVGSDHVSEQEWELSIHPRKGDPFPAAFTATQIRSKGGELNGLRWLLRDISASKRAEERERLLEETRRERRKAEKTNRLLQTLIETMPVGVMISDESGDNLTINQNAREILGSTVHGSVKKPIRSYTTHFPDGRPFPPDDMPLLLALKKKEIVRDVEVLIRRDDHSEKIIHASASPVLDESDQVINGVAVFQDITELKDAQESLRRFADRLQLLHKADQAILTAKTEDEIVDTVLPYVRNLIPCRRVSVLAFDREAGEAIVLGVDAGGKTRLGKGHRLPIDERWPLDKLAQEEISLVEDFANLPLEPSLLDELEQEKIFSCLSVPLVAQGQLLGTLNIALEEPVGITIGLRRVIRQLADQLAIGLQQVSLQKVVQDYTSQLETMVARRTAALHASEARFRSIYESAPIGIAILDHEGKLQAGNITLHHILGYQEEQLVEKVVSNLIADKKQAQRAQEHYQGLVAGDFETYRMELTFRHHDGHPIFTETVLSRIRGMYEKSPLIIALLDDITEQKRTQQALIQSEKLTLLSRLSSSLAHEIKNPLQSVLGCLGLAQEMMVDRADVNAYLDIAMEELENVANIVTQLRDLSHAPEDLEPEATDLNALVERTLLLTRKHAQNKDIELDWKPKMDLPSVMLIPDRVRQVFLNLVLNAIEAMPEGGLLQVKTAPTSQPDGVQVGFRDNGVGIETERLSEIFEPFHSTRPGGMGMGLFISKTIVENHGGEIRVESQPGQGTSVKVWFPV